MTAQLRPRDARHQTSAPETYCSTGTSPSLHLVGLGKVGQAFAPLGGSIGRLVAVSDRSGTLFDVDGLDVRAILECKDRGGSVADLPGAQALSTRLAIDVVGADIVVDAASTTADPTPAIARVDAALRVGARVALAGKAALAAAGARWLDEARHAIGFNAALGGTGARLYDELEELRSAESVACAGNATTTTIISVVEAGGTIEDGIGVAQRRGLLETDPELDLRGADASLKLAAAASLVAGQTVRPLSGPDIRELDVDAIREAFASGRTTRLVGRWSPDGTSTLRYEDVLRTDPLAVPGDRVVYRYGLPGGNARVHVGEGIGPSRTARALLEDVGRFARGGVA